MNESKVMSSLNMLPSLKDFGNVNSNLVQINSARSVAILSNTTTVRTDNFSSGVIDYNFSLSQRQRFSASKSYLRAEVDVKVLDGVYREPTMADNFALAENFMNNIISNSYMYIGSKSISNVSQYHGVCAQLRSRLTKSYSWYKTMGKSVFYLDPDFESRQKDISSGSALDVVTYSDLGYLDADTVTVNPVGTITFASAGTLAPLTSQWKQGDIIQMALQSNTAITVQKTVATVTATTLTVEQDFAATELALTMILGGVTRIRSNNCNNDISDSRSKLQVMFQPPLSPFYNDQCIPTCDIRLSLFPASSKKGAFEHSVNTASEGTVDPSKLSLLISNMYFFAYVFEGEKSFNDGTFYMSLTEIDVQSKSLVESADSDTTRQFNIPSSTLGICAFTQDSNVASPTTLTVCPSKFVGRTKSETDNLKGIQLQYSNQIKPVQLYQSTFNATTQNLVQRYWETQSNANLEQIGGERFEDWLKRGVMSYYSFLRPAEDRSSSLQIQAQFGTISNPTLLFVASLYRKLVAIQINNGIVISVESLNV